MKPRMLDPFDEKDACCHDWLSGKSSGKTRREISSLRSGTVPVYSCPACGRDWARSGRGWILVDRGRKILAR